MNTNHTHIDTGNVLELPIKYVDIKNGKYRRIQGDTVVWVTHIADATVFETPYPQDLMDPQAEILVRSVAVHVKPPSWMKAA